MTRKRIALAAVVAAALAAVITGGAWAAARASHPGGGMMAAGSGRAMMGGAGMMGGGSGQGMMGGGYGLAGDGQRVESLNAAEQRAAAFADRLGLRVGETMQFTNGFYAELTTADGRNAMEVLVDAADGSVAVEYGPAMMWNTRYGMHAGPAVGPVRVSATEAAAIAQRWLDGQRPGLSAGDAEVFPGYYTLHTLRDGNVVGMMSVNAYTGAVWYHTWHGQFIAMSEE
jgi:hypothetical protein